MKGPLQGGTGLVQGFHQELPATSEARRGARDPTSSLYKMGEIGIRNPMSIPHMCRLRASMITCRFVCEFDALLQVFCMLLGASVGWDLCGWLPASFTQYLQGHHGG